MHPRPRSSWTILVVALALLVVRSTLVAAEWRPLLDRELTNWERYLSFRHQEGYKGAAPLDAAGKPIEPVGYNTDPTKVFSMVEYDGKLALRISGEVYGCVFTKEEFSNYRLRLKVKWGTKKWTPRTKLLRDSGILYHSNGPAGVDYWRAWMLGQEFQIMEGHMGDYWNIANSATDIRAFLPEGSMNAVAHPRQPFLPFGAGPSVAGFCLRSENCESPRREWTEIELVCFGDQALHIVNGHVVMVLRNSRTMQDGVATPLTRGRLQLQSEAAEVYFADVEIQPLDRLPPEFAELFAEPPSGLSVAPSTGN